MNLKHLKYYIAFVDSGSLSEAARICGVSQPSMSQQISNFEETVGAKLYDRVEQKVCLTEAGRIFYEEAQRLVIAFNNAQQRISGQGADERVSLSIGILPTLAPYVLPHVLSVLKLEFPNSKIVIHENISEIITSECLRGNLDLAVTSRPVEHASASIADLVEDPFVVLLNESHPLASKEELSVEELNQQEIILLEPIHCLPRQVVEQCAEDSILASARFVSSQLSTIYGLVESGLGLSIVPKVSLKKGLLSYPNLKARELKQRSLKREVILVRHKELSISEVSRTFEEVLRKELNNTIDCTAH